MSPRPEQPELVRAAAELVPLVIESADDIERSGRLPASIVEKLSATGLYHLFLPASAGGPEADPLSGMLAIETLARADASVAWCAHVSSANAWLLATLAPETVAEMARTAGTAGTAGGAAWRMSGSARPRGRAQRVAGGFRVSGQWDFASNCLHAHWYSGTCMTEERDRPTRARTLIFPMSEATIIETWQVTGMRGTGSHDVAVADIFVPEERVSAGRHLALQHGRLYQPRLTMVVNWALTAAVALGVARGALDAFAELAQDTTAGETEIPLRQRAEVQRAVGRAEALLGAARSYCLHSVRDVWEAAEPGDSHEGRGGEELDRLVLDARLAITHAMHTAVEVVDLLFHAGGTRSIFHRHHLERRFRDAHVALRHGAGSASHFEAGGRIALGLPAAAPFW